MERSVELRVLGPVAAVDGARHVGFDGSKPRTAVAALALSHGRTVPDTRLRAMLWGTKPPPTATSQLYTYMSRLRGQLGSGIRIVRRPPGYRLELGSARLDLLEFERLRARGQDLLDAGEHAEAAALLRAALSLWRGHALSDVTPFLAEAERPRLEDLRMAALEARVDAELALGRHHRLVPELDELVAEHPLRERSRAQLMTALYRDNRQAEALAVYDNGRKLLADELGIAPGAALEHTFHTILRGADPTPTGVRAVVSPLDVTPAMLPADTGEFTGRAGELTTLTGPGDRFVVTGMVGVGKTALAVRAGHLLAADRFPDGQLYADLGGARGRPRDPSDVLAGLLRALGVAEVPAHVDERAQLYRDRLAGRRVLVVLDDAASGTQVGPLLPGSATCRVVVTARRLPAVLAGARVLDLAAPPAEEALALLAAIVGADRVAAEPETASRLVELCGHLPLAVRVAGARLAARPGRPLSHLVRRLAAAPSMVDELFAAEPEVRERLRGSVHDLSPRHGSALRQLARLEVLEFPVWAAAQVLSTSPDTAEPILDDLIDARLLECAGVDANGQPRFRMHPVTRHLAREPDQPGLVRLPSAGQAAVR